MQKRATFRNLWLASAFITPQLLLVSVFFYWPTAQAFYWSLTLEPAFGGGNQFVGLENFRAVFADANYWASVGTSLLFALGCTVLAVGAALMLALFADPGGLRGPAPSARR